MFDNTRLKKLSRDKVQGLELALKRPKLVKWLTLSGQLMSNISGLKLSPLVSSLPNLEVLEIEHYNTIEFPTNLSSLPRLHTILLTGNEFSPREVTIDSALALPHLETFAVDIFDSVIIKEGFASAPKLERLHIGEDKLVGLSHVCRINSLKHLVIDSNVEEDLSCLQRLTNLKHLQLSCGLTEVPEVIAKLYLESLSLAQNPIAQLPEWLASLALKKLDVSGTKVTSIPNGFKELEVINIKHTRLNPEVMKSRFVGVDVIF